jgi:hypothetical protein
VEQLKAALVGTANLIGRDSALRTGAGIVDLPDADAPLVFATPSAVSFGVVRPGATLRATIRLGDAGGGAGSWEVTVVGPAGQRSSQETTVPGTLTVTLAAGNSERDEAGWIVLRRGGIERRIPYWFAVVRPRLAAPAGTLRRAGTYRGSTRNRAARVVRYRYPDLAGERMRGPEQVFRFVLGRGAANLGVAVTSGSVEPRILTALNENRVAGYTALPVYVNPYDDRFDDPVRVAAVIHPIPRAYYVVFDSHGARGSPFTFRVWIGDTTRPSARLLNAVAQGGAVRFHVSDTGSGIDPASLRATVGQARLGVRLRGAVASVDVSELRRGSHTLVFTVGDRQESKNNENVAGVLPNTRRVRATIRIP